MTAWHGDPVLKERIVARMHAHRQADGFIQGLYQKLDVAMPAGYRGCAIGCLLDRQPLATRDEYGYCQECGAKAEHECSVEPEGGWHKEVERQFGIPWFVADRIDATFEGTAGHDAASDFAVAVIEAIPVGADLSGFGDTWNSWSEAASDGEYFDQNARTAKVFELIAAAPIQEVSDGSAH